MGIEDGELDFSHNELFPDSNMGDFGDMPNSCSMDSLFDDMLKDTHTCTHTHTCNPPGPDYSHTHTCYHVHTKLLPASTDEKVDPSDDTAESDDKKSKKRPLGNREAVRKYREKKKARTASLEDEVIKLRTINQQLMKRLQGQAVLEAEVARFKCLLVDIRGRIEGEIGSFPYQKTAKSGDVYKTSVTPNLPGSHVMNPCNMQCDDLVYCLHPGGETKSGEGEALTAQGFNDCDFGNLQCMGNQNSVLNELSGCGLGNGALVVNGSGKNKGKGGARAARAS